MAFVNISSAVRISVSGGGRAGNENAVGGAISPDGRFVVYESESSSYGFEDVNGAFDVFLRDTATGILVPISMSTGGDMANNASRGASMSDDGRFVAFASDGDNLVADDTNGLRDIFVRDVVSGTTVRASVFANGVQSSGSSGRAMISGDGRFIAFDSTGADLVVGETSTGVDVFLKDRLSGELSRVSISTGGDQQSAGSAFVNDVSTDGRFVVFISDAPNLVTGDTNGTLDVFVRDTALGLTRAVSINSDGATGDGGSFFGAISSDGRYVVFTSSASDLVAGDTNGAQDVFLRDTIAGVTTRVSVSSSEVQGDATSRDATVSDDGRFVVFESQASNLVEGDTNGAQDVFLRDLATGVTIRLSVDASGAQLATGGAFARIAADGRSVLYSALDGGVTPGDANDAFDIFRVSLFATAAGDLLLGSDGADVINGLAGSDILRGGLGVDTLDGGSGLDTLEGGGGNDIYRVNTPGDRVVEAAGGGVDNVVSTVSYVLGAGQEVETLQLSATTGAAALNLTGNGFTNTLRGNDGANTLNGAGGADAMYGLGGNDVYVVDNSIDQVFETAGGGSDTVIASVTYALPAAASVEKLTVSSSAGGASVGLTGNAFVNALQGGAGANVLDGKGGSDSLRGLAGNDVFAFTTALGPANRDTIVDFGLAAGNNDSIRLENAVFTALTTTGALASAAFVANAAGSATTAAHRIVYDTTDGRLLYDADGSGAGAAVQFATLTGAPTLAAADIFVV